MLSRKHRFHGYGTLRRIYSHSQTVRGSLVGLKYSHNRVDKEYRAAVVVAKKVSKSAVARNRIRRRIFETIRTSSQTEKGIDYIFTVYNEQILELSSKDLTKLIDELLIKTKQKNN